MGALITDYPDGALLLVDAAPIIYVLEGHARLADRFRPIFLAHETGRVQLAITTIVLAEVLVGPLQAGQEDLAQRYRSVLESWQVVPLDSAIAERAARLRVANKLKLADAVQAASALAIGAWALVTHDRDFGRVPTLRVLS
jgi:predicted nucleic acid-binding protein